jgi:hypothetical protein
MGSEEKTEIWAREGADRTGGEGISAGRRGDTSRAEDKIRIMLEVLRG